MGVCVTLQVLQGLVVMGIAAVPYVAFGCHLTMVASPPSISPVA